MHTDSYRNRLAAETSPYLRQHAGNPVDWYPWGEEALALAQVGAGFRREAVAVGVRVHRR